MVFGCLIPTVGTLISSAIAIVAKVAPVVAAYAQPLFAVAKIVLPAVLDLGVTLISEFAKYKHIVSQNMSPVELGARAMENPDIKPEDYDTTKSYVDALCEKGKFDRETFEKNCKNGEHELAYKALGAGIEMKAIQEEMKMRIPEEFYFDLAKGKVSNISDVINVLDVMKKHGIFDASMLSEYIKGGLPQNEEVRMNEIKKEYESMGGKSFDEIRKDFYKSSVEQS